MIRLYMYLETNYSRYMKYPACVLFLDRKHFSYSCQLVSMCFQYTQQNHVQKTRPKWMKGQTLSTVQKAMATPVSLTKTLRCY